MNRWCIAPVDRRIARAALGLLVAGVALLSIAGWSAAAAAQSEDGFTIELQIDGDRLTVDLVDVVTPVGALDLTVGNLPGIAGDTCEVASGTGLCNFANDLLEIVAFEPAGWDEPAPLADLTLSGPVDASTVWLRINVSADVAGQPLAGTVVGSAEAPVVPVAPSDSAAEPAAPDEDEGGGGGSGVLIAVIVVVAVVAAGTVLARRRSPAES